MKGLATKEMTQPNSEEKVLPLTKIATVQEIQFQTPEIKVREMLKATTTQTSPNKPQEVMQKPKKGIIKSRTRPPEEIFDLMPIKPKQLDYESEKSGDEADDDESELVKPPNRIIHGHRNSAIITTHPTSFFSPQHMKGPDKTPLTINSDLNDEMNTNFYSDVDRTDITKQTQISPRSSPSVNDRDRDAFEDSPSEFSPKSEATPVHSSLITNPAHAQTPGYKKSNFYIEKVDGSREPSEDSKDKNREEPIQLDGSEDEAPPITRSHTDNSVLKAFGRKLPTETKEPVKKPLHKKMKTLLTQNEMSEILDQPSRNNQGVNIADTEKMIKLKKEINKKKIGVKIYQVIVNKGKIMMNQEIYQKSNMFC